MKAIFFAFLFVCVQVHAQPLTICTDKTTTLIFPFPIKHVDRGTASILVQTIPADDHILLIKAKEKDFEATNLTVITSDGSVYSLPVLYYANPYRLIYRVREQVRTSVENTARSLADNPPVQRGPLDKAGDCELRLTGVYVNEKEMYFQLRLANYGSVSYDLDFIRWYIRDRKKAKRSAQQELALEPIYVAGALTSLGSNNRLTWVTALNKFTLRRDQQLVVELQEKNGGRHFQLIIGSRKILRARKIAGMHTMP